MHFAVQPWQLFIALFEVILGIASIYFLQNSHGCNETIFMPPLIFLFPFGCSLSFHFNKFPHFCVTFFSEANHAVAVVLILCFGGDAKFEYWVTSAETFESRPFAVV